MECSGLWCAETGTLFKVDKINISAFEAPCKRRTMITSETDNMLKLKISDTLE